MAALRRSRAALAHRRINIAALLLARTADREREISLRFALGASRRTVIAQLLSELLLLAILGAVLGLALAGGAVQLFHYFAKALPRVAEIALNWRLLLYTFASALVASLLSGLYPALRSTRGDLAHTLAQSSHTHVSTRGSLQWLLVGAQVAFAVTLLVGAGLLLRSLEELGRVSPGFDASHVVTLQLSGLGRNRRHEAPHPAHRRCPRCAPRRSRRRSCRHQRLAARHARPVTD
ncbi:MAG TPA: FtsX-like permease family protein [Acidobacteriaceae bacterium]